MILLECNYPRHPDEKSDEFQEFTWLFVGVTKKSDFFTLKINLKTKKIIPTSLKEEKSPRIFTNYLLQKLPTTLTIG